MRSHDAARVRADCEASLPRVLESAGLTDGGLTLDRTGWVNVCFIGDEIVVRFNGRDPHLPKFHREEWAYRVLRDRGFPVPRVLAHIEDPDIAPYPVLIVERIHGENLEANWSGLGRDRRHALAAQAGEWQARLHAQPARGFGELFAPDYETHADCWRARAHGFIDACDAVFEPTDIARFRTAVDAGCEALGQVQPRWVHNDFHFGNLLFDGDKIVALLDFEWAMASDPAVDRAAWPKLDEFAPGAREPYESAYRAEHPAFDDEPVALALYRLTGRLELSDVAASHFDESESADYHRSALQALRDFETFHSGPA